MRRRESKGHRSSIWGSSLKDPLPAQTLRGEAFPAALYGCAVEYMPNCFEAYFIDELIGTFSSKVEAAAELLLHAMRIPTQSGH